jgi:putative transposase
MSPFPSPENWVEHVNAPQTEAELEGLRRSVRRGCPFGSAVWQKQMAARQGLSHTLRPLGRPRKTPAQEQPRSSQ